MEDNSKFKLTYDTLNSELSKLIIVYPPVFFLEDCHTKVVLFSFFTLLCPAFVFLLKM